MTTFRRSPTHRSSPAGRTLKLSDIAGVRRGYEDPPTYLIRHQGEPVSCLPQSCGSGWDGLALGKALEIRTAEIARTLPLGMTLGKGERSGRQHHRGGRRVHGEVRDGARRGPAGEPDQPRMARRHRRVSRRPSDACRRLPHHVGDRSVSSIASHSVRSSSRSVFWSTTPSSPSR